MQHKVQPGSWIVDLGLFCFFLNEDSVDWRILFDELGAVAKWLGSGLQIREHRFESGRRLHRALSTLHPEGLLKILLKSSKNS